MHGSPPDLQNIYINILQTEKNCANVNLSKGNIGQSQIFGFAEDDCRLSGQIIYLAAFSVFLPLRGQLDEADSLRCHGAHQISA